MNAVAILISFAFWTWLWGVPGALLAMPLLVTLRIFCEHLPSLAALGEFLSGRLETVGPSDANEVSTAAKVS
jgi:predicted PurR-regulated permease PerM